VLILDTPWDFDGGAGSSTHDLVLGRQRRHLEHGSRRFAPSTGISGTWRRRTLDVYDMDFETIALHRRPCDRLGHTGDGSAPIIRDDIAVNAFWPPQNIDVSQLAVAINYTYSVQRVRRA
jgi:hypothetical protein